MNDDYQKFLEGKSQACGDNMNGVPRRNPAVHGGSIKYIVCQNGNRISVKRADRNNDFGQKILARADTLAAANRKAVVQRREIRGDHDKPISKQQELFHVPA